MSAILLHQQHGITPSILHSRLINNFQLLPETPLDVLESYYLLYWSPEHFFTHMKDGMLEHNGVKYMVVYHKCTPEGLKRHEKMVLSFRSAKDKFHLVPYVLVNVVKGS
jgi:hypothetical protein